MPDIDQNDSEEKNQKKESKGFFGTIKGIPKWFKGLPSKAKENPRKAIMITLLAISIPMLVSGALTLLGLIGIFTAPAFLTIVPGFLVIIALGLCATGLMLSPTATSFLDEKISQKIPIIGSKNLKKDLVFSNENKNNTELNALKINISSKDILHSLLKPADPKDNKESYCITGAEKFQEILFSKSLADLNDLNINGLEAIIEEAMIDEYIKEINRGLTSNQKDPFNQNDRNFVRTLILTRNEEEKKNITSLANDMKEYTIEYLKKCRRNHSGKINKTDLDNEKDNKNYLQEFMETKFRQQNMKTRFGAIGGFAGVVSVMLMCALAMGPLGMLLGPALPIAGIVGLVMGIGIGLLGGYINQKYASEDLPPHKLLKDASVSEPSVGHEKSQEHRSY